MDCCDQKRRMGLKAYRSYKGRGFGAVCWWSTGLISYRAMGRYEFRWVAGLEYSSFCPISFTTKRLMNQSIEQQSINLQLNLKMHLRKRSTGHELDAIMNTLPNAANAKRFPAQCPIYKCILFVIQSSPQHSPPPPPSRPLPPRPPP